MSEFIYRRERVSDGVWSAENTGEEIVRCCDCKWCGYDDRYAGLGCTRFGFGSHDGRIGFGEGFCAWAEQRERQNLTENG